MKRMPWEGSRLIDEWICTFTPERTDDGQMCGRPAEYEIDFGWASGDHSLACAEHAAWARAELNVVEIKSI